MNRSSLLNITDRLPRVSLPRFSLPRLPGIPTLLAWYHWRMDLEQLVIFDDDANRIWRVELPRSELLEHFDHRSRYVRSDFAPEIIGVLIMLGFGWFLGFTFWYMIIPAPMFDMIMGAGPAFLIGAPGWWIGPLFGPKAHWMARRSNGRLLPLLHGMVLVEPDRPPDPDGTSERIAETVAVYERIVMEGVEVLTAEVMYEVMEMRDEKAMVTSGLSRWQKIALTGVFTLLGSMVVALFFFGAVFSQQGA